MKLLSSLFSRFAFWSAPKLNPYVVALSDELKEHPELFGVRLTETHKTNEEEEVVAYLQYGGDRKWVQSEGISLMSVRIGLSLENIWIDTHDKEKISLTAAEKRKLQKAVDVWIKTTS